MSELINTFNPKQVLVRELHEGHRVKILEHLLALDETDRQLRFGMHASNEMISAYVEKLNFTADTLFGVFNHELQLDGLAHLAYSKNKYQSTAEFGVSVSARARGLGVGSALFKRAATHARNANITILYVHCLASNKVMMHIAKKAGMEIDFAYGEADAFLKLPASTNSSIVSEVVQAQMADIDYAIKKNFQRSKTFFMNTLSLKRIH
jgi:RimJ/RimL family protein N-acetyltransferase